jgi:glucose/arabinose dehydrogenase
MEFFLMLKAIPAAVAVCLAASVVPAAHSAEGDFQEPANCRYGMYWSDTFSPPPAFPGQTRAPRPAAASKIGVDVVATGLSHPWSMAFLPDGSLLVTERGGTLRSVDAQGRISEPLAGLPSMKAGPPGSLFDIALDPDFAHNRRVYIDYFAPPAGPILPPAENVARWQAWLKLSPAERRTMDVGMGHVARAVLSADGRSLEQLTNIVDGNLEGRLRFARDGSLMISSGTPAGGSLPSDLEPQDTGNAYGKVLRVRTDGSIPADNPFVGRAGFRPDLYTYGARDIQGLTMNPATGQFWSSENGPRGGDEINIDRPGSNLGHPLISYGREYSSAPLNGGLTAKDGLEQPVYFWTPSIAPSGLSFYSGARFPAWRGNLFVAALAGKRLERLVLDGERVVGEEPLLLDRCQRMRAVYEGPDGYLYVITDEDPGQVLRIRPVTKAAG